MPNKIEKRIIFLTITPWLVVLGLVILGSCNKLFVIDNSRFFLLVVTIFCGIFAIIGMLPVIYLQMLKIMNDRDKWLRFEKQFILSSIPTVLLISASCGLTIYYCIKGLFYGFAMFFIITLYLISLYFILILFYFVIKLFKYGKQEE